MSKSLRHNNLCSISAARGGSTRRKMQRAPARAPAQEAVNKGAVIIYGRGVMFVVISRSGRACVRHASADIKTTRLASDLLPVIGWLRLKIRGLFLLDYINGRPLTPRHFFASCPPTPIPILTSTLRHLADHQKIQDGFLWTGKSIYLCIFPCFVVR